VTRPRTADRPTVPPRTRRTTGPHRRAGLGAVLCGVLLSCPPASAGPAVPAAPGVPGLQRTSAAPRDFSNISTTAPGRSRAATALAGEAGPGRTGYWTGDRMRSAGESRISPVPGDGPGGHAPEVRPVPRGGPPLLPSPPPGHRAPVVLAGAVGPSAAGPARLRARSVPRSLAGTHGKVFFTDAADGHDYVCSGTVVNSEGGDTVWTAGHCVHRGGGSWHLNWVFVPAYHDGQAPCGVWRAVQLWTRSAWATRSDLTEDLGVAVVAPRDGVRIVDAQGGQGLVWNLGKSFDVRAFGYPQSQPFDGSTLIGCSAPASPEWTYLLWSADTLRMPCDMTAGSSGGAWLRGYDPVTGHGYVNGLNSYKYGDDPSIMYSPYFDEAVALLYDAVRSL